MEKMLFNSKSGNLFEVLVSGGGMGTRSFTVQLWSNLKKKWINTHINHTVTYETPLEEVIEVFKEKVENSTFA